MPAGSCATVGISGLALGGGVGVVGRKLGLTCDRLRSVQLVTADGTVRTCTPGSSGLESDLFWASQGGGGGNFGIATQFTFETCSGSGAHHLRGQLAVDCRGGRDRGLAFVGARCSRRDLVDSAAHRPSRRHRQRPIVRVAGVYIGSNANASALVDGLVAAVGGTPSSRSVYAPGGYVATMLYEAGCSGLTVDECHLPTQTAGGQLTRKPAIGASDYVDKPLSTAGINVIVDFVNQRQADPQVGEGGAQFDSYGGAINRVAADATAFAHRSSLAGIQRSSSFSMTDSAAVIARGRGWLDAFTTALRPYVSGGSYVNYEDPNLANFLQAYYGRNLSRLQSIKHEADPDRLFTFPQAI